MLRLSVAGLPSLNLVTVVTLSSLCQPVKSNSHLAVPHEPLGWHAGMSWGGKLHYLQEMVIMVIHDEIRRSPKCKHALVDPLSFYCPRGSRPFSASNCIRTTATALVSGQASRHAACHSNFTLSVPENQALTWLFLINAWYDWQVKTVDTFMMIPCAKGKHALVHFLSFYCPRELRSRKDMHV